jgi:hypothetical protein
MITLHPRLFTSYVLTTLQQAILDFEPLASSCVSRRSSWCSSVSGPSASAPRCNKPKRN